MRSARIRRPLFHSTVALALLLWAAQPCRIEAQSSPPNSLDPPSSDDLRLEQAWQKASSKYDSRRAQLLQQADAEGKHGSYHPDWDSLSKYEIPQWFRDAKFGIFIHWGVYSVPAFANEWYPRNMYIQGFDENKHQVATYGPLTKFGYKDFIPMFKAEHYDPKAWAELFRESGARYIVPVFEHHDGFAMYDSHLSDWTAMKMGPHRDLVGDLVAAARAQGLHVGASSHRIEHDWFMDGGTKLDSDVRDPKYAGFYGPAHRAADDHGKTYLNFHAHLSPEYASDWLARNVEIVNQYHPDVMYFDWWINNPEVEPYLKRFAAYYYNQSLQQGPVGVIQYKYDAMRPHSAVLDIERGQLSDIRPEAWQTDTSISNQSWGYIAGDSFKSSEQIVQQLVDVVSKNGNLLLNVGPRSDGTIPDEAQQVLRDIGAWLRLNGEAIYDTHPWKTFGEGPTKVVEGAFHDTDTAGYTAEDFRFTAKGDVLYAIELKWPTGKETVIRSLNLDPSRPAVKVASVTLLGSAGDLHFEQRSGGLYIEIPSTAPAKYACVFRITFQK
jgi:alpha-L-fucosidase